MFNGNYSLADVAAAAGNNGAFGGETGAWWIIILFLFCFMGGGWGGYNGEKAATANEVQNDFNFASLERQNQGIIDNIHQAAYDVTGAVKDGNAFNQSMMKDIAYDINGELKDNAWNITSGIRDVKDAVMFNGNNIDKIRYDGAMNTKELLMSNSEQTQKILDVLAGNRMADMQNQINALQLQAAMCGVVRYPMASTWNAGPGPFYGPFYGPGWNNPGVPGPV